MSDQNDPVKLIAELKASASAAVPSELEEPKKTYVDPQDGTLYEWDSEKRAWFPKIDEEFLAGYQANYGFTPESKEWAKQAMAEAALPPEKPQKKKKEKGGIIVKAKPPETTAGWFEIDDSKNTNVYVSGLNEDTTEEEFIELMMKCGIIMEDPDTSGVKIRMYKDEEGYFKGDALCCYLKKESVDLAIKLLDESVVNGKKIHVEKAVFHMKGDFNPKLRRKKPKGKKKKKNAQDKLLGWKEPVNKRAKNERIVILKNMFDPKEFEENPLAVNDVRDDIKEECKKYGQVKKVLVFDRNPEGVASVAFKEPEMADECISALNGRYFGGKNISVEIWDGTTNYQIEETDEEQKERLKKWEKFLEK